MTIICSRCGENHTRSECPTTGVVPAPSLATSAIDRAALATDQAMRAAFERWMIDTAKIIIGSQDPYPAGLERDFWRVWQAAWRAGRAIESRKNSRSDSEARHKHWNEN